MSARVYAISLVKTVVVTHTPHEDIRKIIKVGETSLAVILPKSWLRYYHLTDKDKVIVVSNGNVTIKPPVKEEIPS